MEILHQDPKIVVCIKPVGMESEKELPQVLEEMLGGTFYPVHRLDQNVGGLMVFARIPRAAAALSRAIQEGQMIKEYYALVHGTPKEGGELEDFLFKDSGKNKVFVVKKERRGVKKARLSFKRLTTGEVSLVRIRLFTGRSHQIRVQFASRGFPLVGDHKYGSRDGEKAPMLFSCGLRFPLDGKNYRFFARPDWVPVLPGDEPLS